MEEDVASTELGEVSSEHAGRNVEGWLGAALIAGVGAAVTIGDGHPAWSVLPVAVGLLWLGLSLAWTPTRVVLRAEGLELHRRFRPVRRLRFDDCRQVFREFTVQATLVGATVTDYTLRLVDERNDALRLRPKSIREAERLFARIERLVVYPRNRDLRDAFEAGEDVSFGEIVVGAQGLRLGTVRARWGELRELEVSPKLLVFHFHHARRRTFRVARIPFPWALVRIVEAQGVRLKYFDGFRAP